MSARFYQWFMTCLLLTALTGCGDGSESDTKSTDSTTSSQSSAEDSTEKSTAPNEPKVEVATWEELQEKIAAEKGKVVVLDMWATYCPPCIRELPGLVKLHDQYGDKVVCLSVALEYDDFEITDPKDAIPAVREVLTKINANFESFIAGDVDETFYKKSETDAVPTILIYDKSGKLHKKMVPDAVGGKEVTYAEHIVPLVEELLAE